jgi:hypothetical protein
MVVKSAAGAGKLRSRYGSVDIFDSAKRIYRNRDEEALRAEM